ncbi:ribokinase [Egicoccus sp. AB-alg6-2]|uniref:ribokinase n=1 Tax=Egicoccus sp. AB-alg6-2 TaxID=3242692 RepID=UPI00359DAA1D
MTGDRREGVAVTVVGSANLDVVVAVPAFPAPGETVMGDHLEEVAGGKGLNQAVAAAAEAPAAFVGCVGDDEAGRLLLGELDRAAVDVSRVVRSPQPTGRAYIEVTPDGENRIVVMALANGTLEADAVGAALTALQPRVVLAQLEVPLVAVEAAATWAADNDTRFVLNASPVRDLAPDLLARCDPLIVNRGEAAAVLGSGAPRDAADQLARRLAARVASVVVTDGAEGAYVATNPGDVVHVPGLRVTPVDTTGAGDVFAGTLAASLSRGASLADAAGAANDAAARIVQLSRAQR